VFWHRKFFEFVFHFYFPFILTLFFGKGKFFIEKIGRFQIQCFCDSKLT